MPVRDDDSFLPSVFDRLTMVSNQPSLRWGASDLRRALIRDLEWLLNTRNWLLHEQVAELSGTEDSACLAGSLAGYGLPDFSVPFAMGMNSREFFRAALEDAIRLFEPRLESVGADVLEVSPGSETHEMYFEIRAELKKPAPARVVFQAVLNLHDGAYTLKEE